MISVILTFSIMILIHEFGHLIIAKKVGMKVKEFALGFGPKIFSKTFGETEYSFRIFPLGGFNDINMDPTEEQQEGDFYTKPLWARVSVLVAGGMFNMVSAYIAIFFLFMYWGVPEATTRIDYVYENMASTGILEAGDKILSYEGITINKLDDLGTDQVKADAKVDLLVERDGEQMPVTINKKEGEPLGITFEHTLVPATIPKAIERTNIAYARCYTAFYQGMKLIFEGEIKPTEAIAGPIGVGHIIYKASDSTGPRGVFIVFALLSINLGILNLLPIPLLDGGHVVIQFVQAAFKKNMTENQIQYVSYVGMAILGALFLFGLYSDYLRLMNS